jgi:hypothetical protein
MTTTPTPTPAPTPEPCKKNDPVFLTDAPTPLTDAVSKEIGSLACRWKTGDIDAVQFEKAAQQEMDKIATLERELVEARAILLTREGELDAMSAALAAKDREIERRKAQLDMWTSAAMDGNAAIAQQAARAEKAEAELAEVKDTLDAETATELCDTCGCHIQATLVESGECIYCTFRGVKAERDQLRARLGTAEAALAAAQQDTERLENLIRAVENTLSNIPAYHEGDFIVMHYDGEGRELGPEYIDPFCVVGHIDQSLRAAIAAARKAQSPC